MRFPALYKKRNLRPIAPLPHPYLLGVSPFKISADCGERLALGTFPILAIEHPGNFLTLERIGRLLLHIG